MKRKQKENEFSNLNKLHYIIIIIIIIKPVRNNICFTFFSKSKDRIGSNLAKTEICSALNLNR